jgi:CheY-like chemotaxis protein
MPVMDGWEATKEIREMEHRNNRSNHVPIIALTAEVEHGIRELCIKVGMYVYML